MLRNIGRTTPGVDIGPTPSGQTGIEEHGWDIMPVDSQMPGSVSVMGVNLVPFRSYSQASQCIGSAIETGNKMFCVAINPEKVYRALHDPSLRKVLSEADIGICDGVGVAIAARILNGVTLRRCTGVDLFLTLIDLAARRGLRVFLLGASHQSNAGAYSELLRRHPNLRIVGRQDGYFEDSSAVVDQINATRADLLFVAMGSPKQEYWISRHRDRITARFCMGVGGTFDVLSGQARRAPAFFRKTGTEFLFRLITDPRRWRRQVVLILFIFKVLAMKLTGRRPAV